MAADKCTFNYPILSGPGPKTMDEIVANLSKKRGRMLSNTVPVVLESPDGNQFHANLKLRSIKPDAEEETSYKIGGEFDRAGESLWVNFSYGTYNARTQKGFIAD